MNIEFEATDHLSDGQKNGIAQLRSAVYPPEVLATLPGKLFTWASPQWSVLLWDEDELVSRVGLIVREIVSNGEAKMIGGVGGVMTHPERQGKGYASTAMREAAKLFDEKFGVSFALLFCRPHLVEFYKRLGWKPFQGLVFVEQSQGKIEFSANGAMVLDVKEPAPLHGVLNLNGLPW
ncbi:MAG TPA: GNAT family N-acetyltransferase [Anaerolineales bacterium]|nr:GNAT family N-acetyltransferase [Anaerolineales bacterium]